MGCLVPSNAMGWDAGDGCGDGTRWEARGAGDATYTVGAYVARSRLRRRHVQQQRSQLKQPRTVVASRPPQASVFPPLPPSGSPSTSSIHPPSVSWPLVQKTTLGEHTRSYWPVLPYFLARRPRWASVLAWEGRTSSSCRGTWPLPCLAARASAAPCGFSLSRSPHTRPHLFQMLAIALFCLRRVLYGGRGGWSPSG